MGFFQNVGLAMGRNMVEGQNFDNNQATIELKQQQAQMGRMAMQQQKEQAVMAKQQQQMRQSLGAQIADMQKADKDGVQDPEAAAKIFQTASMSAMSNGDWTGGKELATMAQDSRKAAKEEHVAVEAKIKGAQEDLARAAIRFATTGTPQDQDAVVKAATKAGVNAMDIPPPNSPQFKQWAEAQQTTAMSSKDQLAAKEKALEFDLKHEETVESHMAREQQARDNAKATAVNREIADATRRSTKVLADSFRKEREDRLEKDQKFKETETLTKSLQRAAAPYVKDRQMITTVTQLLSQGSPEADQQVRQLLPSLVNGAKGRATNKFYDDNKNFGSLVQRMENFASRATSGKYSEVTRKELSGMLNSMQNDVIDPTITRLEKNQKAKAQRLGVDPENIAVDGDFNRMEPKAAQPEPLAPALTSPGKSREASGKVSDPAINPADYYKENGKWYKK